MTVVFSERFVVGRSFGGRGVLPGERTRRFEGWAFLSDKSLSISPAE